MIVEHEAVTRARELADTTADPNTRETVTGLLRAHGRVRRAYLYLLNEGRPEPFPEDAPAGSLEGLEARWRSEAETLRAAGAEALATLSERHAYQLEAVRMWEPLETVTLEEAAEIGGYSYSHLQHMIADGRIPNAGEKGAPRIFLRDVPRKPGHRTDRPARTRLELIESTIGEGTHG